MRFIDILRTSKDNITVSIEPIKAIQHEDRHMNLTSCRRMLKVLSLMTNKIIILSIPVLCANIKI